MKIGKLGIDILEKILEKQAIIDPRVVIGPKVGEDAAVIDLGEGSNDYLVVTSDPITFTTEEIGYYGVVVNLNDIATRGAIPRWFSATLLFPEEGSDVALVEKVFSQIYDACRRFGISLIGGHTEVSPGISKIILSGHMIGEVKKEKLVTTSGARAGDLLLLVKGVCIEGTSIIAREKESELLARGISSSLLQRAKAFIFNPGIEVLRAARIVSESASVHAMHDPTEGGLINGVVEMARASQREIEIDLERVYVYEESRVLCGEFGLDPLGVIASGALLLALAPSELGSLEKALGKASIPFQVIGNITAGPGRVLARDAKGKRDLEPLARDEILKIY